MEEIHLQQMLGNSKNEITFGILSVGADGENLKKMVDEYNKTDPEFKIKNVSLKESDMYTKILLLLIQVEISLI